MNDTVFTLTVGEPQAPISMMTFSQEDVDRFALKGRTALAADPGVGVYAMGDRAGIEDTAGPIPVLGVGSLSWNPAVLEVTALGLELPVSAVGELVAIGVWLSQQSESQ